MNEFPLLARATLGAWRSSASDAFGALRRTPWLALVPAAYTLGLGLVGSLLRPLGIVGQFAGYLATAAALGSYLSLLEAAVGRERTRLADLGPTFGRHLGTIVGVFFLFWIVNTLLALIEMQNPAMTRVVLAVQAGIFVAANPVPELVYQGRHEGLGLIDDAVGFVRENAPEWLLPQAVFLLPLLLDGPGRGLDLLGGLGSANALLVVAAVVGRAMPAFGGAPLAVLVTASALLSWAMLFRGFLFRALNRSGRRQRIFEARMRS